MNFKIRDVVLLAIFALSSQGEALAQQPEAFCALRDPDRELRLLIPDYIDRTSWVRTISKSHRVEIEDGVPFDIHFDELGQHTVYKVTSAKGTRLVHVRSEAFNWGLVRVAWLMNSDLEILDYRFQRCRVRKAVKEELLTKEVKALFANKSMKALQALLTEDGESLRGGSESVSEEAKELFLVLVQSAIKTTVVTDVGWRAEVRKEKAKELAAAHFGRGASLWRETSPYTQEVKRMLSTAGLQESVAFDREKVLRWRVRLGDESTLAGVYFTPWSAGGDEARLFWVLDAEERVLEVVDSGQMLSLAAKASLDGLIGRAFKGDETCNTACELAALELSILNGSN